MENVLERSNNKKQLLLVIAAGMGTMLNPLNTTMIAVAFSRLQEEFGVDYSAISWLIATFYLASAVAQPVMGKLGDLFGYKRMFFSGLAVVTIASMLAPLSSSIGWLIGFRILQAIGTSTLGPSGMAVIRSHITENQARWLGIMSVFSATSAAFGPTVGGILIHYGDWPAIFLINFPIIVIAFIFALKYFPKDRVSKSASLAALDWWGIGFFAAVIFVWLLFFLSIQKGANWWLLAAGIVLSMLFYAFESRRRMPFVDVLFLKKNLNVCKVYFLFILVNIVTYSMMFGIPTYLQQVRQFNTQTVGIIMLSIFGFGVLISPPAGRWIDRSGPKPPLLTGMFIGLVGTLLLLAIHNESSPFWIFTVLSIIGLSTGFQNLGLQTMLYAYVSRAETGIAYGLFMTSRFMGTILSSGLLGVAFSHEVTTSRLHLLGIVCGLISAAMLCLVLFMPRTGGERD